VSLSGSGKGPVEGFCEHGDGPSGFGITELVGYENPFRRSRIVSCMQTDGRTKLF
jgi:hypothetical protein